MTMKSFMTIKLQFPSLPVNPWPSAVCRLRARLVGQHASAQRCLAPALPQPGEDFAQFPDFLQGRTDALDTAPVTLAHIWHRQHPQSRHQRLTHRHGEIERGQGPVPMLDKMRCIRSVEQQPDAVKNVAETWSGLVEQLPEGRCLDGEHEGVPRRFRLRSRAQRPSRALRK